MKYNKTQALQEHLKVITCYLSDLVAPLFVSLIADILSFYKFLTFIICRLLSQASVISYLWYDQGTSWATEKLTQILQQKSQLSLQASLSVVAWRDVVIIINKKLICSTAIVSSEHIESINHMWQAGHTESVKNHHIALTAEALQELDSDSLEVFHCCSQSWHDFFKLGADSSSPASSVLLDITLATASFSSSSSCLSYIMCCAFTTAALAPLNSSDHSLLPQKLLSLRVIIQCLWTEVQMLVTIVIKLEQSVILVSPLEPQSVRKRAHLLSLKSQMSLISSSLTGFDHPACAWLAL